MFTPITGRTVFITGGKGLAKCFAGEGVKVAICGRDAERGRAAAAEIGADGAEVIYVQGDVAVAADVERMVGEVVDHFGGLDIVCANAGIFSFAKLEEMTEADIDAIFGTNVKGVMLLVKAAIPALARSGHGRVVITSSITGPITGFSGWSHYGATKAAQLGFIRSAAIELAKYDITVNAVLPGNVATEGLVDLGEDYIRTMEASVPLRRLGSVEDIGNVALFLSCDEAGFITGQTLVVDGGQTLPESIEAFGV
jgi:3-oxoacyl-[acyl-carrier protein] reductase